MRVISSNGTVYKIKTLEYSALVTLLSADTLAPIGKTQYIAGVSRTLLLAKQLKREYQLGVCLNMFADMLETGDLPINRHLIDIIIDAYYCESVIIWYGRTIVVGVYFYQNGSTIYKKITGESYCSRFTRKQIRRFIIAFALKRRQGQTIDLLAGKLVGIDSLVANYDIESALKILPLPISNEISEYLL